MFFKLEKLVFLALVFSIPFQKRSFLFGPEEFLEWNSAFFYFTDALVLMLLIGLIVAKLFGEKSVSEAERARSPQLRGSEAEIRTASRSLGGSTVFLRVNNFATISLGVFLFFALFFISQAELVDVAAYRFLKLAEFIFLFFYVSLRARYIGVKTIMAAFVASGVFQSILAVVQFAKQSSLGLQIFHESTLDIGMKGVAEIVSSGVYMIRAYGTFPNPNVLAGFLGISLFFAFYLFLTNGKYLLLSSIFILSLGLLLTFSRGVIIFFVFTSVLFFTGMFLLRRFSEYRKQAFYLLVLVIVSWLLVILLMWPEISSRFLESSVSEPAVAERLFFNKVGVEATTHDYSKLFLGVGIGNFVNYYMGSVPNLEPRLYQPVHNVFILIASEIGILGLAAFIVFLAGLVGKSIKTLLKANAKNLLPVYLLLNIIFLIFLIAMYDHYFWTLQQGALMFWIALGLLVVSQSNPLVGKANRKV